MVNMFTEKSQPGLPPQGGGPRRRGRPPGPTPQGEAARRRLFRIAIQLIARRGYEATTLRDIALKAGVSVGLLYRYFPNKRAVVFALYDELSNDYAARASTMAPGVWSERFGFALRTSLAVLGPHREVLAGLVSVLVGDREQGLFAQRTAFSRARVQAVFIAAVSGAWNAPERPFAEALGRLLYLLHLVILLWWLLDASPQQRATTRLLGLLERAMPLASAALRLPGATALVESADAIAREGLFGDAPS